MARGGVGSCRSDDSSPSGESHHKRGSGETATMNRRRPRKLIRGFGGGKPLDRKRIAGATDMRSSADHVVQPIPLSRRTRWLSIQAIANCQPQGPPAHNCVLAAAYPAHPCAASHHAFATRSVIVLTSDFTALTLLSKAACSWASSFNSMIFSTPRAPRMTGTPT